MTRKASGEPNVPMRRCVGCMKSFPKKEVIRIAAEGGRIIIDRTGRANGRGAYLCRSLECFDLAVKKKRFGYALKVNLQPEETLLLREEYAREVSDVEFAEVNR